MKVLLDTSFFLDVIRFRVDLNEITNLLTEPYQLVTLDLVIKELEKIACSKSKVSGYAKIALKLIKTKNIKILASGGKNTDEAILQLATKDIWVATNDLELRKRLRENKIKTIYLRGKKYLAIS